MRGQQPDFGSSCSWFRAFQAQSFLSCPKVVFGGEAEESVGLLRTHSIHNLQRVLKLKVFEAGVYSLESDLSHRL